MARTLAQAVEAREPYAHGHSERVGLLSVEIAIEMGCSDEMIKQLQVAARIHDIGKIVIPDYILFKPGPLTPAEFNEIKRHPTVAVDIIRYLDQFPGVIPLVEGHHEWYNGEGYPNRLKGDEIPLGARILAVADAYDAMTCPRPYRERLSSEEATRNLAAGAWTQWDPVVVEAALEVLEREHRMLETLLVES